MRAQWPGEQPEEHRPDRVPEVRVGSFPRRATDRVERVTDRLLVVAALVVVVLAVIAGTTLHGNGVRQAAADAVDRVLVDATLTTAADVPIGVDMSVSASSGTVHATWEAPDGSAREGDIPVIGPKPVGSVVPLWVDRAGTPSWPPVDRMQAAVTGIVGGTLVALLGALLLVGVRALVRVRCAAVNHRAWERQWRFYEPVWSGRSPSR